MGAALLEHPKWHLVGQPGQAGVRHHHDHVGELRKVHKSNAAWRVHKVGQFHPRSSEYFNHRSIVQHVRLQVVEPPRGEVLERILSNRHELCYRLLQHVNARLISHSNRHPSQVHHFHAMPGARAVDCVPLPHDGYLSHLNWRMIDVYKTWLSCSIKLMKALYAVIRNSVIFQRNHFCTKHQQLNMMRQNALICK